MFVVGKTCAAVRVAAAWAVVRCERSQNLKDGELELERRKDLRPGFTGPVDWPEWRERRRQEEAEAEDDTGSSDDEYEPLLGRPCKRRMELGAAFDPRSCATASTNLGSADLLEEPKQDCT